MDNTPSHLHTFTPSPFGSVYAGKRVLVTGNTGFKGSWLTLWLLRLGAEVYGFSKDIPTKPSMFEDLALEKRIAHYYKDVRELGSVKEIIDQVKPDFLFHLAAQPLVSISYTEPVETISTNVIGTTNVLEGLRTVDHKCVGIIITSDKCYDNVEWVWGYKETDNLGGKDIYSGSKGAAELIIKAYFHSFFDKPGSNVKIVSARAGNVIGGGDWAKNRIVPDCIRAWGKKEKVEIRNPKATRPWQHVLEPLSGYLTLGMRLAKGDNLNGESFNFGPSSQYTQTVESLIESLSKYWNNNSTVPMFKITGDIDFHEAGLLKLNCDKALAFLNWQAILSPEKTVEFTGSWYNKFYRNQDNMLEVSMEQIESYCRLAAES